MTIEIDWAERSRRVGRTTLLAGGLLLAALPPTRAAQALPAGSLYDDSYRWTDDSGARVELSDFRGQPTILTMFYSDCATTCSITLEKLRAIEARFERSGIEAQFVLVSFDSSLESPRTLARFRDRHQFSPARWHLLTGSAKSVKSLARRIGLGNFSNLGDHIAHAFRYLLLDENGVCRNALDPWHSDVSRLFEAAAPPGVPGGSSRLDATRE